MQLPVAYIAKCAKRWGVDRPTLFLLCQHDKELMASLGVAAYKQAAINFMEETLKTYRASIRREQKKVEHKVRMLTRGLVKHEKLLEARRKAHCQAQADWEQRKKEALELANKKICAGEISKPTDSSPLAGTTADAPAL